MKTNDSLKYDELNLEQYVNTREVFAGLNVADLAKAAVLGGLNFLAVGDTGTGKSQLATDIYDGFFNGNKAEGGHGVFIKANPDIMLNEEVFTSLNIERACRERTKALESMIYFVDELNRAPPVAQNQFFGLGDGSMEYQGRSIPIGKDGYHLLVATANIGNGEFAGTFATDKALFNRLHVVLDLEHGPFQPTYEDKQKIRARKADPNVIRSPKKDLTSKILAAWKEISDRTLTPAIETQAVLDYLEHGLQNCQEYPLNGKDRAWPMTCQGCNHNKDINPALCSRIRAPTTRTLEVVRRYASALEYLAKLKNPDVKIEPHELIFQTFELTGAYQHLLNPAHLRDHHGHNPRLMAQVVKELREDYEKVRPFILASLGAAEEGHSETEFFVKDDEFAFYDGLDEKAKAKNTPQKLYTNARPIGLGWVPELIQLTINRSNQPAPESKSKTRKGDS